MCWFAPVTRAVLLLFLCGCPLPEDQFELSGQLLDVAGKPRPNEEVRLLRNQVASERRCDALEPLETTRTGEDGRYAFTLIRQQITRGVTARRFFRVEADEVATVVSQSFWFPDADLALGPLSRAPQAGAWQIAEARVDERLAWRTELSGVELAPDRPFALRRASTLREWRTVPIDSLGRYDIVPVEWREEGRWAAQPAGAANPPSSRGAQCPFIDVTPCPLTDGRYVPYEFPEGTRTIVLNFTNETSITPLLFHGLLLERTAAKVRLEFNFVVDFENWNRLATLTFDPRLQEVSGERCNEPGAFVLFRPVSFIKPVLLRIAFEDEAGELVPIVALSELSAR